jgi:hypothetical protein
VALFGENAGNLGRTNSKAAVDGLANRFINISENKNVVLAERFGSVAYQSTLFELFGCFPCISGGITPWQTLSY